jgi:hypothetical protein
LIARATSRLAAAKWDSKRDNGLTSGRAEENAPGGGVPMPTREQVQRLLDDGLGYDDAARRLGIHPGLAQLIATGMPVERVPSPVQEADEEVLAWIRERAAADLAQQTRTRPSSSKKAKKKPSSGDGASG